MKSVTKKLVVIGLLSACLVVPVASAFTASEEKNVQTCSILGDVSENF
ncbi:MAG: hypothetical protein RSA52_08080 [Acetivibrio sp.]